MKLIITEKDVLERFLFADLNKVKVYYQLRPVKYADYKVGLYYVDIDTFLDFRDPEKLF